MMEKRFGGFRNRNGLHLSEKKHINNAAGRNGKGFTLVELIVVLVILAVLAALIIPAMIGFIDRAKDRENIANAEKALNITQTVLNEVYNSGGNQVHPFRRQKAETDSGVGEGTRFKVWTKAQLEDGITPGTSDHLASYLVEYAQFTTGDGKEYYYDGKEWSNRAVAGTPENVIYMWGYVDGDTAFDPKEAILADEDIEDSRERDINDFVINVTLKDSEGLGLTFAGGNSSYTESFNGDKFIVPDFDISVKYIKSSVCWKYNGNTYGSSQEITDFLRTLHENANIEMIAEASPNYIEIPVTFSAFSEDTLSVERTEGTPENLKIKIFLTTPNQIETDIPETPVSCAVKANQSNVFFDRWANGDDTFTGVSQAVADARRKAKYWANQCVDNNAVVDGIPAALDYVAYAGKNKTVYVQAKEGQESNIYFGDDEENRTKQVQLSSYERLNDGKDVYCSGNKVYEAEENKVLGGFDIASGLHIKNNKNIKFWHIFDCIVNGGNKTNEEQLREDFSKDVLARLFGTGSTDRYYALAEIELTGETSMLAFTDNNSTASPVDGLLSTLAGNKTKINNIYFVSPDSKPNYGSSDKEVCLSTTTLKKDGANKLLQEDGKYVVDFLDENYPAYTVAYRVSDGAGKYDIYVFTEDNSNVAARGSLNSMFKNCSNMQQNQLVAHMNTELVTGTTSMFEKCNKMTVSGSGTFMNTQNVTDMSRMFFECFELQTLNLGLDTRKAINMERMFESCKKASTDSPVNFNLDSATNISYMFQNCGTNSTGFAINFTGKGNEAGNALALNNNGMTDIFKGAKLKELELHTMYINQVSGTDPSSTTKGSTPNAGNGFYKMIRSGIGNLERIVFEDVTVRNSSATSLFLEAANLEYADVSGLSMPENHSIRRMFSKCSKITENGIIFVNGNKNFFKGSGTIYNATTAFSATSITTTEIAGLDTSDCKYVDWMFEQNPKLVYAPEVHIDSAVSILRLFNDCTALKEATLVGEGNSPLMDNENEVKEVFLNCNSLESFTIKGEAEDRILTFTNSSKLKAITPKNVHTFRMENLKFNKTLDLSEWFKNSTTLESFTMDNVELSASSLIGAFDGCSNVTKIEFGDKINTANVTDMSNMFRGCFELKDLDVTHFNTANVAKFAHMFDSCYSLEVLDISSFKISHLTLGSALEYMFGTEIAYKGSNNSKLTTIYATPVQTEVGTPKTVNNRKVFGTGLVNLAGGEGTTLEAVRSDPRVTPAAGQDAALLPAYAKIDDGTHDGCGYFTNIADKPAD